MLRAWRWLVPLSIAWVSQGSVARAQSVDLRWSAPRGCPRQALVQARVVELTAEGSTIAPSRAEARVVRLPDGRYRLDLAVQVAAQAARRQLVARDCATLADTAAWLIALALAPSGGPDALATADARPPVAASGTATSGTRTSTAASEATASAPAATEDPPREPAAPAPEPPQTSDSREEEADEVEPPPPPPPEPEEPPEAPSPPRKPLPRWARAVLAGGVWTGGMPGPQASLEARGGAGFGPLYAELRLGWMFARSQASPDLPGARAEFSSAELGASVCGAWGDRVRAGPCAILSALRSQARSEALLEPARASFWWLISGVSAQISWLVVGPLELSFELGAALPVTARPRFVVHGVGPLLEASYLTGFARLGVGVRLP